MNSLAEQAIPQLTELVTGRITPGMFSLLTITRRTGATATDLDALATAQLFIANDVIWTSINGLTAWRFTPGPANPADPGQMSPPDYNAILPDGTLNNFHWTQNI